MAKSNNNQHVYVQETNAEAEYSGPDYTYIDQQDMVSS